MLSVLARVVRGVGRFVVRLVVWVVSMSGAWELRNSPFKHVGIVFAR